MDKEYIDNFVKKAKYDYASFVSRWESYEIYSPRFFDDEHIYCVGGPLFVLVNDKIRWSTRAEELKILKTLNNTIGTFQ